MAQKSIIGLTGGIGSGKSAAAKHFSDHGVSVVDADQASREVVKKGEPALSSISDYFGEEILNKDGSLDRSKLRAIVFKDEKKRKWLAEKKPFSKYALLWLYAAGGGDVTNQTATGKYLADMKDFMADK